MEIDLISWLLLFSTPATPAITPPPKAQQVSTHTAAYTPLLPILADSTTDTPPTTEVTASQPVIPTLLTRAQALAGSTAPQAVLDAQQVITVTYIDDTGYETTGQLVIHRDAVADIIEIMALSRQIGYPFTQITPVSEFQWSDDASMAANNTAAFNYRPITGGTALSSHSGHHAVAIDINPQQNPYIKGTVILPPGSVYDPTHPQTLTADHPLVQRFKDLGWTWGGDWEILKDYQHFEKALPHS